MKRLFKYITTLIGWIIAILITSFVVVFWCFTVWDTHMAEIKKNYFTCGKPDSTLISIHNKIKHVTEISNRVPPVCYLLTGDSLNTVNAYATGYQVFFTYAAVQLLSKDEIALIMGHEIAHSVLHHTDNEFQIFVFNKSNENELMADNLGAFWANKAGYDVCKGREVFKKFYIWSGNSLNGSHPPNKYRYDNLEHYCEE